MYFCIDSWILSSVTLNDISRNQLIDAALQIRNYYRVGSHDIIFDIRFSVIFLLSCSRSIFIEKKKINMRHLVIYIQYVSTHVDV